MEKAEEILLSPIDALPFGLRLLFLVDGHLDANRLRSSLEETLEDFWELQCVLEGLMLKRLPKSAHLFATESRHDVESKTVPNNAQLINELKAVDLYNTGDPTLAVKVTALEGGTALGITFAHSVVDAHSVFRLFFPEWSRRFSGDDGSSPALSHDRSLFRREMAPDRINNDKILPPSSVLLVPAQAFTNDVVDTGGSEAVPSAQEPKSLLRLHFTDERLKQMKKASGAPTRTRALFAHVWSAISSRFDSVSIPVNAREQLPNVSKSYFGNGLLYAVAALSEQQREQRKQLLPLDYARLLELAMKESLDKAESFLQWASQAVPLDGSQALLPMCGNGTAQFTSWVHMPISPTFGDSHATLMWNSDEWPPFLFIFTDAPDGGIYLYCDQSQTELTSLTEG